MKPRKIKVAKDLHAYCATEDDVKSIYEEIFVSSAHATHGIEIRDGDCIFDLGANIGLFALWANKLGVRPKVFAYEPIPSTFKALEMNVAAWNIDVECRRIGVGNEPGSCRFTSYQHLSMISTMTPDDVRIRSILREGMVDSYFRVLPLPLALIFCCLRKKTWRERAADILLRRLMKQNFVECDVDTLGNLIEQSGVETVDLLKIDTEGNERDILESLSGLDWEKVRQLIVEVHDPDADLMKITQLLQSRGYSVNVEANVIGDETVMVYARTSDAIGQSSSEAELPVMAAA